MAEDETPKTGENFHEELTGMTVDDLHKEASKLNVEGRSNMNKDELVDAIEKASQNK